MGAHSFSTLAPAYHKAFRLLNECIAKNKITLQKRMMPFFSGVPTDAARRMDESPERILVQGAFGVKLFLSHPSDTERHHFPGLALGAYPLQRNAPSNWMWWIEVQFGATGDDSPTWFIDQRHDERYPDLTRPDIGIEEARLPDIRTGEALRISQELIDFYDFLL